MIGDVQEKDHFKSAIFNEHRSWSDLEYFFSLLPDSFWNLMIEIVDRNLTSNWSLDSKKNPVKGTTKEELSQFYGRYI